jgi:hypothetical protein
MFTSEVDDLIHDSIRQAGYDTEPAMTPGIKKLIDNSIKKCWILYAGLCKNIPCFTFGTIDHNSFKMNVDNDNHPLLRN